MKWQLRGGGWGGEMSYTLENLAFETINAFATVTSFLGSFRFCSFISRVPCYHCEISLGMRFPCQLMHEIREFPIVRKV